MDAYYYKKYEPIWGAWHVKRLLGEGSFGKVFEIERNDYGGTYTAALKALTIPQSNSEIDDVRADGMDDASVYSYFRGMVDEIVNEFVLMSKLKGTSNVVSYEDHLVIQHDSGIGWDILIRMELLTSLNNHVKNNSVTHKDIIQLGIDICKALELCQKYNIIHRDIKPENIFISENGDFKIGDFGIARTAERTSGMSKKGTYSYMAPEVYRSEAYGSSVDIYSLGLVLYRLLNENRLPFLPPYPHPVSFQDREKAMMHRVSGAALPMPKSADGRLGEIVLKACAFNPKERYSSPMLMRQELEAILYSRAEAPIIYPMGDDAPIKSAEYAEMPYAAPTAPIYTQMQHGAAPAHDATESMFGSSFPPAGAPPSHGHPGQQHGGAGHDATESVYSSSVPPANATLGQSYPPGPVGWNQNAGRHGGVGIAAHKPGDDDARGKGQSPENETASKQKGWFRTWMIGAAAGLVALVVVLVVVLAGAGGGDGGGNDSSDASSDAGIENGASAGASNADSSGSEDTGIAQPSETAVSNLTAWLPDETFNSLLYGYYFWDIVSDGDQDAMLEYFQNEMVFEPSGTGYDRSVLPVTFLAGPLTRSNEGLPPHALEEHQIPGVDFMFCQWFSANGELIVEYMPYMVEGNKLLLLTDYSYEAATGMFNVTAVSEIEFYFEGRNLVFSREGMQFMMLAAAFYEEMNAVLGYVSDSSKAYKDISFFAYMSDSSVAMENIIVFTDGRYALEPILELVDDGIMHLSWNEKHDFLGNAFSEPGSISCSYISNAMDGFILIDGSQYYLYQSNWEDFVEGRLGDSLDVPVETLSDDEARVLITIQSSVLTTLEQSFQAAGIEANVDPNNGRVTMDTSFLFAVNDYTLSDAGKAYLDGFLDVYADVILSEAYSGSIAEIIVEGHTDSDGSYDMNMELSERRAASVAEYCLSRQPGLAEIMMTRGHSYDYPVLGPDGAEDKEASRRVVFKFILSTG